MNLCEEEYGMYLNKSFDVIEVGINVVLTAHAKIVRFEAPDEMGAYDRYELKLGDKTTAKTAALVKEWADMVLFVNYKTFSVATDKKGTKFKGQGGERKMYAVHHPAWDAKNRHDLPDEMPMDYGQIAHVFVEQPVPEPQPVNKTNNLGQTSQEPVPMTQTFDGNGQPVQQNQPIQESMQEGQPIEPLSETSQEPQTKTVELDPNIPKSLRDLMIQHNVSEEDI